MSISDAARAVVGNTVKAIAPRGMAFRERRHVVASSRTRTASFRTQEGPAAILLLLVMSLLGWLLAWYKERRRCWEATLASTTPVHTISELCHVLRGGWSLLDQNCAEPPSNHPRPPPLSPAFREIADAVYAHVRGNLWVAGTDLVRAPFSGERVAFCEATVTRIFDQWVSQTVRRQTKAGRKKGELNEDDPGSDSEYEETDSSSWERREAVQSCQRDAAKHLYVDDGTGRILIACKDPTTWASEQAEHAFRDRGAAQGGAVGMALRAVQATVTPQRDRGVRREEKHLRTGERLELVGEARVVGGSLVLQEPSVPPAQLHRVSSLLHLNGQSAAPSALLNKGFTGVVLRNRRDLASAILTYAWRWRVAKWALGFLTTAIVLLAISKKRRRLRGVATMPTARLF